MHHSTLRQQLLRILRRRLPIIIYHLNMNVNNPYNVAIIVNINSNKMASTAVITPRSPRCNKMLYKGNSVWFIDLQIKCRNVGKHVHFLTLYDVTAMVNLNVKVTINYEENYIEDKLYFGSNYKKGAVYVNENGVYNKVYRMINDFVKVEILISDEDILDTVFFISFWEEC